MIRRIRVQNFLSLKDVTVDLSPLTVFIGPNASGKSAIFKALKTLSMLLGPAPLQGPQGAFRFDGGTFDNVVWQGNSGLPIVFTIWWPGDPDEEPGYILKIGKESRGWSVIREKFKLGNEWFDSANTAFEHETERLGKKSWKAPYRATLCHLVRPFVNDKAASSIITPVLELKERFGDIWRYHISAGDVARFAKPLKSDLYVRENGSGLSVALQRLQGANRILFSAIEQELSRIFPHIKFINFQSEPSGVGLAFTTDRSEDLVPGSQESDGVLTTTFLLWRLFTAPENLRICLEEPENGLHPYLLGERMALLKRFTASGATGARLQLLVATHSPDFISTIQERTEILEMVRVVEFDRDEGTKVYKLSSIKQIDTLLDVFKNDIGDLWWSGAIGAVPTSAK